MATDSGVETPITEKDAQNLFKRQTLASDKEIADLSRDESEKLQRLNLELQAKELEKKGQNPESISGQLTEPERQLLRRRDTAGIGGEPQLTQVEIEAIRKISARHTKG